MLAGAIVERFGHEANTATSAGSEQRHRTVRSADFEPLVLRMREVLDFDPEAKW